MKITFFIELNWTIGTDLTEFKIRSKAFDDVASFSCFHRNMSRNYYLKGALVCYKHFNVREKYILFDPHTLTMAKQHHKV